MSTRGRRAQAGQMIQVRVCVWRQLNEETVPTCVVETPVTIKGGLRYAPAGRQRSPCYYVVQLYCERTALLFPVGVHTWRRG